MYKVDQKISLVITESVDTIDGQKDCLVIRYPSKKPLKYPLISIREIILYTSCQITSKALCILSAGNIPLLLVDYRGNYMGQLQPGPLKNFSPRKAQMKNYFDEGQKLFIAKKILDEKLHTISTFTKERKLQSNETFKVKLNAAKDFNQLRGIEGAYSKEHFRNIEKWLKPSGFEFEFRSKRPPTDPVNCLLSLTYTLIMGATLSSINQVGLDPAFGFLHQDYYGRPSLACDLMEKWRTEIAERFTLRTLNRKELTSKHFEVGNPAEGYSLTPEGRKIFYAKWFPYLNNEERIVSGFKSKLTFRQAVLSDVRQFSQYLENLC